MTANTTMTDEEFLEHVRELVKHALPKLSAHRPSLQELLQGEWTKTSGGIDAQATARSGHRTAFLSTRIGENTLYAEGEAQEATSEDGQVVKLLIQLANVCAWRIEGRVHNGNYEFRNVRQVG